MSKIIEKAFDASKKIVRSIFRGSPNLITTSDLNRQFEALKYQVDKLDEKTGFIIEGAMLNYNLVGSTLSVDLMYDSIEYKGCTFTPDQREILSTNLTDSAPYAYFCLVADKETITYDTDSTHEIAGAKFADGTSMRAADQVVYRNERFVLTHSIETLPSLVGIIAFLKMYNGKVYIVENWTDKYSPLRAKDGNGRVGANFDVSQKYPIKIGDTYDVAFGKIQGFLGEAKVYTGCWLYTHASLDEVGNDEYQTAKKKQPAYLIKEGSVFRVYLDGLSRQNASTLTLQEMVANIKSFLMDIITKDCMGGLIFDHIPESYNVGKLIGASVNFAGPIEIKTTEVSAAKSVNSACVHVGSFVRGDALSVIEKSFIANFSSVGVGLKSSDYTSSDDISIDVSNIGGIGVVLTFANEDYFRDLL